MRSSRGLVTRPGRATMFNRVINYIDVRPPVDINHGRLLRRVLVERLPLRNCR